MHALSIHSATHLKPLDKDDLIKKLIGRFYVPQSTFGLLESVSCIVILQCAISAIGIVLVLNSRRPV